MKLLWTKEALSEITGIMKYIAQDDPSAATVLAGRIFDTVEKMLPDNPLVGRPGRVDGTRELVVHSSYLVAYRVADSTIEVLTVRHAARLWPEMM